MLMLLYLVTTLFRKISESPHYDQVYELGWNWNDLHLLAQGSLAGHLLECGCQLTGGYYMHPGESSDISGMCTFLSEGV